MANLGAEVSRIISARERGDEALVQGALERAKQILLEVRTLSDMQPRIEEIETLSKAIGSLTDSSLGLHISPQNIKSYFTPFALRAMSV